MFSARSCLLPLFVDDADVGFSVADVVVDVVVVVFILGKGDEIFTTFDRYNISQMDFYL